ncbi:hypothetical protein BKA62DRAFT_757626 [Auriculariales sp. MPI-PUGE-AT-0066]|nr:hypothetical protein BKA62DRAFT_757626 [Auriculariales sp. MPI-PUGE-AT-0066]
MYLTVIRAHAALKRLASAHNVAHCNVQAAAMAAQPRTQSSTGDWRLAHFSSPHSPDEPLRASDGSPWRRLKNFRSYGMTRVGAVYRPRLVAVRPSGGDASILDDCVGPVMTHTPQCSSGAYALPNELLRHLNFKLCSRGSSQVHSGRPKFDSTRFVNFVFYLGRGMNEGPNSNIAVKGGLLAGCSLSSLCARSFARGGGHRQSHAGAQFNPSLAHPTGENEMETDYEIYYCCDAVNAYLCCVWIADRLSTDGKDSECIASGERDELQVGEKSDDSSDSEMRRGGARFVRKVDGSGSTRRKIRQKTRDTQSQKGALDRRRTDMLRDVDNTECGDRGLEFLSKSVGEEKKGLLHCRQCKTSRRTSPLRSARRKNAVQCVPRAAASYAPDSSSSSSPLEHQRRRIPRVGETCWYNSSRRLSSELDDETWSSSRSSVASMRTLTDTFAVERDGGAGAGRDAERDTPRFIAGDARDGRAVGALVARRKGTRVRGARTGPAKLGMNGQDTPVGLPLQRVDDDESMGYGVRAGRTELRENESERELEYTAQGKRCTRHGGSNALINDACRAATAAALVLSLESPACLAPSRTRTPPQPT